MKLSIYITATFLLTCGVMFAQRPPAISSPDVNADHSITFRYYSKTAQRVTLKGEFLKSPLSFKR
jgi:enterochelin esterase family protein